MLVSTVYAQFAVNTYSTDYEKSVLLALSKACFEVRQFVTHLSNATSCCNAIH